MFQHNGGGIHDLIRVPQIFLKIQLIKYSAKKKLNVVLSFTFWTTFSDFAYVKLLTDESIPPKKDRLLSKISHVVPHCKIKYS